MQEVTQKRQLAAIMFTDIVGYTALMGEDSNKALELIRLSKEIQKPLVEKHNGKWLKEMGDGAMAQFSTALDAVKCAIEIQKNARGELNAKLRIGIHLGDITIENNDIYGDGVNVASRLESIADPGGIYISDSIEKAIRGQSDVQAKLLGEISLKNVNYGVKTYALQGGGLPAPNVKLKIKRQGIPKTAWLYMITGLIVISIAAYYFTQNNISKEDVNEIKTVAVLPFKNLSEDSETAYFVDGIMRVILDNLARIGDLEVTSGRAVEPYADGYPSAKEVGEELNVDYLIETSVQKIDNKIKIMVQLIDTRNERQIWDETYEEEWKDVLKLQSELSLSIAENLNTRITDPEIKMIQFADDIDPLAQDYIFKAWEFGKRGNGEIQNIEWAIDMAKKAIAIDSTYTMAWMVLGDFEINKYFFGHDVSADQKLRIKYAYDQALLLQPELFDVQWNQANYMYSIERDYQKALQIYEQLANQYPQKVGLKMSLGNVHRRMGNFVQAAEYYSEVITLRPTWTRINYGQTLQILRKYKEAERVFLYVIEMRPDLTAAYQLLAEVQIDIDGNTKRARETLSQPFLKKNWEIFAEIELRDRNFGKAIELWESAPEEGFVDQLDLIPKSLGLALVYYMIDNDSAQTLFKESLGPLVTKLDETPDDWRLYASLGLAYAGLGEKQKAMETVEQLDKYINSLNDALNEPVIEQKIIRINIMIEEYELALELIRSHLNRPVPTAIWGSFSINDLKLHPMYDPLRELPEFQAILENPKYQIILEEN